MAKAEANGVYTDANGHRFRIKAGDEVPDGAMLDGETEEPAAPKKKADAEPADTRDKGAAPENRAKAEKAEKA